MATTARNDYLELSEQSTLYDGDFIDLTHETNQSQTFNLQIDEDLELVNISTKTPNNPSNLNENPTEPVTNTLEAQSNDQVPILANNMKFLIPIRTSDGANKYLLLDQSVVKSPIQLTPKNNNVQTPANNLLSPNLTKLNFKNTGGKITVEETPITRKQNQNIVIHNDVRISPVKTHIEKNSTPSSEPKKNAKDLYTESLASKKKNATTKAQKTQMVYPSLDCSQVFNTTNMVLTPSTSEMITQTENATNVDNDVIFIDPPLLHTNNSGKKGYVILHSKQNTPSTSSAQKKPIQENKQIEKPAAKPDAILSPKSLSKALQNKMKLTARVKQITKFEIQKDPKVELEKQSVKEGQDKEPLYYFTVSPEEDEAIIQDPLDPSVPEPPSLASPCIVTPVDIITILNKAKKPEVELVNRCDSAVLKKPHLYTKGFTKIERKKPPCLKYLQAIITSDENKIKELKKSQTRMDFIQCRSEPSNFLPEVTKYELDDNEEFCIEYNNIDQQVRAEMCFSAALPVIKDVISDVRDEVVQLKKTRELKQSRGWNSQMHLSKPEEALRLIQKGLKLIKDWSQENEREKKVQPKKKEEVKKTARQVKKVTETKTPRTRRSNNTKEKEKIVYQTTTKTKRGATQNKKEITSNQNDKSKRGTRKRKVEEYTETSDLLIVKKVDILNEKKKRKRRGV